MGERGACRVKCMNWISPYLRQQWCTYRTSVWMKVIKEVAKVLLSGVCGVAKVNSEICALRKDLMNAPGRLFLALVNTIARVPFDEITCEQPNNIADHGLFELEIVEWNRWILWHYNVEWNGKYEKVIWHSKEKVLEVMFIEGRDIDNGMQFVYVSGKEVW